MSRRKLLRCVSVPGRRDVCGQRAREHHDRPRASGAACSKSLCSPAAANGTRMSPRVAHAVEGRDLPKGRRSTQRERLLAGVLATVDEAGYAGTSVSRIIGEAGVSRPTFYDYFSDKEDCLLGALRDI